MLLVTKEQYPGENKDCPGQDRPGGPVGQDHRVAEGQVRAGRIDGHDVAGMNYGNTLHLKSEYRYVIDFRLEAV